MATNVPALTKIEKRRVLRLVEPVTFESRKAKVTVKAKVDSGAKRTSIDGALAKALGVKPLDKTVKVRSASRKTRQTRRLVRLLRVGGKRFCVEASIADRGHLKHPLLVGRDVLAKGRSKVKVR